MGSDLEIRILGGREPDTSFLFGCHLSHSTIPNSAAASAFARSEATRAITGSAIMNPPPHFAPNGGIRTPHKRHQGNSLIQGQSRMALR